MGITWVTIKRINSTFSGLYLKTIVTLLYLNRISSNITHLFTNNVQLEKGRVPTHLK